MKDSNTKGLLKISDLARRAGVSATTVKYYVREGLVPIAYKTGPNMAYYEPASVERVKLIKMLQTERFYPLSVIKRLLERGAVDLRELELMDVIHKSNRNETDRRETLAEAARSTGLSKAEIHALEAAGAVHPALSGKRRVYADSDLHVLRLAARRKEAGIPLVQTIRAFTAYEEALRAAVEQDVASLTAEGLLAEQLDTRDIVRIIRVSDETLDEYVTLQRYALNREIGSALIGKLEGFITRFSAYLAGLRNVYAGRHDAAAAEALAHVLAGERLPDEALSAAASFCGLDGQGIAISLSVCRRVNRAFRRKQEKAPAPLPAVRLGWIVLAPPEFGWNGETEQAKREFLAETDPTLSRAILALLGADEPAAGEPGR